MLCLFDFTLIYVLECQSLSNLSIFTIYTPSLEYIQICRQTKTTLAQWTFKKNVVVCFSGVFRIYSGGKGHIQELKWQSLCIFSLYNIWIGVVAFVQFVVSFCVWRLKLQFSFEKFTKKTGITKFDNEKYTILYKFGLALKLSGSANLAPLALQKQVIYVAEKTFGNG